MSTNSVTNIKVLFPDDPSELAARITNVLQLLANFSMSPDADQKQWVLDQIAHSILDTDYSIFVQSYNLYVPEDQKWSTGTMPELKANHIGTVEFKKST